MQQYFGAVALGAALPAPESAPVVVQRALAPRPFATADDAGDTGADALLRFNRELLEQALTLVVAHDCGHGPSFSSHVGPHLRHVIEHYEAMLLRPLAEPLDYDNRARDRDLERCTLRARSRLLALQARLQGWTQATLDTPVQVINQIGCAGEIELGTTSTLGRELVYLASHAVHHFALLSAYCLQHGFSVGRHFGKAPATVAHELQR